jgi:hypothetical protein
VDKTSPHITYRARDGATPEDELSVLASVYKFILDCRAKENAAGVTSTNGDDAKGSKNVRARQKYTG